MKVFCDKGAERKFRQEERRAAKKVAVGGQRVLDMYHQCQVRTKMSTVYKYPQRMQIQRLRCYSVLFQQIM